MKVRVDEDSCVGDGTCAEVCPEVFEMRDDVAVVKVEEVPESTRGTSRILQGGCRLVSG